MALAKPAAFGILANVTRKCRELPVALNDPIVPVKFKEMLPDVSSPGLSFTLRKGVFVFSGEGLQSGLQPQILSFVTTIGVLSCAGGRCGTTRIDIFSAETGPEAVRSGERHQPTMSRQNLSETSDR